MKKTVRFLSFFIAILTALSFAACSAQNDLESAAPGGDAYFNSSSNSNSNKNESIGGNPESGKPNEDYAAGDDAEMLTSVGVEEVENQTTPELDNAPVSTEEGNTGMENETAVDKVETETEMSITDLINQAFIKTENSSFSTFSADVDTASYAYFRKLVNSGYDISALRNSGSNFRAEEFINYFKYSATVPKENELFGVYSEMIACPWSKDSMLLRMTLQAPIAEKSAGNNLVFLIDVSGSMSSSDKLPLLKKAFSYLVGNLTPADTVSIVTYSGVEQIVLDGCRGGNTAEIMNAINSLNASGSTNGEAGLTMAYQIAEKHMIEGGNNRIIMASDGDLNVGISSSSELKSYIEGKRDQGVYLSVLGFGSGNYKDDRMEALADNGNGVYYYIDGESEAEKVFGTDLSGTLYTVASDVKLQIEFNKEFIESYRLIGYDNRILDKEDFENDQKDAGEVGASHQVTVCYEIRFKGSELDTGVDLEGIGEPLMTLRVRYKKPGETLSRLNEYALGAEIMKAEPTVETRFIAEVIKTVSLLRNRDYSGELTLKTIAAELSELELEKRDMIEFRELVDKLAK